MVKSKTIVEAEYDLSDGNDIRVRVGASREELHTAIRRAAARAISRMHDIRVTKGITRLNVRLEVEIDVVDLDPPAQLGPDQP